MADLGGHSVSKADFTPLWVSEGGIKTSFKLEADGSMSVLKEQDMGRVLDDAAAMRNHNDGWNKTRDMRRVAHLPQLWIDHCRSVEGWDPLDPENGDRLVRVLNDPDHAYFRTAPGHIGISNGVVR